MDIETIFIYIYVKCEVPFITENFRKAVIDFTLFSAKCA